MKKALALILVTIMTCMVFAAPCFAFDVKADESESTEDRIYKEDIVDIWKNGGNGIRILTTKGEIWFLLATSGKAVLRKEYDNVKSVEGKDHDAIFLEDNSYLYGNSTGIDYELNEEWLDLSLFTMYPSHAVGLKKDGTWISAGSYVDGERDVDDWTDIIALESGDSYTLGLKSDGTVVATGLNDEGQCNVSNWEDIIQISTAYDTTLGLKQDGTVVATGNNKYGQCDVSDWTNVVMIGADYDSSYGITKDGRILTTSRSFKYDEDYCQIPSDYRCNDYKKIDLTSKILIVHNDNSIDYFGPNKEAWEVLQNIFNRRDYISVEDTDNDEGGDSAETKKEYTVQECTDIALGYMKYSMSQHLKNPASLQIISTLCIDKDETTYWIAIDYSAMNSFGGYERNTYYCQVDYITGTVINAGTIG